MTYKKITATLLLGALGLTQPVLAHNDASYSHDSGAVANNANWMSRMSGTVRVSEMNLPGTHDTMSIKAGDAWQNQTMTLREQMDSGVRVFDMRTRHIGNSFRMHHGIIAQDTYFNDVLRDIDAFLVAHPSETILFRLRPEHTSENNSRSYEDTLKVYLNNTDKRYSGVNNNPTLDEIRGKFVILQEFSGADYGIPYNSIDKQDSYSLTTNWDLYNKWTAVKNHMEKAEHGNRNTLYMNYLSGAVGSFPYFVASGHSSPGTGAPRLSTGLTTPGWNSSYPDFPRTSCFIGICTISFEGTNTLTANYIGNGHTNFVGMVMADFPGKKLIDKVINLNELSGYSYNEFTWGTGADENTRLCTNGAVCIEGDKFSSQEPAGKSKLSVVSYNVMRPSAERIANQVQWLKNKYGAQGPDVILLSETVRGAACGAGRNTAREYAKAFNAYYVNANEDGPNKGCQTGNAIVSRYPMGNVGMIRFNSQSGDWADTSKSGRNAVFADLKVGDDLVHVYSTHTHHSFGAGGDSLRKQQHAEMVFHAEGKPFTKILGGDLNSIGHVFADPLSLHDISLNPLFDKGYQDAHDSLWTHQRITAEAGLADNDWTMILDFIFTKDGSSSNAGLCTTSHCRNKGVMSDHAPIWADVTFQPNGATSVGDFYPLSIAAGNKCLDFHGSSPSNEALVVTWDCADVNWQKWQLAPNGQIKSKANPDFCLDMEGSSPSNNTKLIMWKCTDVAWQKWSLDGSGRIHSQANPAYCVDIVGSQAASGTQVIMWECADVAWQKWDFVGKYRQLKNAGTGLCMDVEGANNSNGTNVLQWTCVAGVPQQLWKYEPATGFLRNKMGRCLDNTGNAANNGAVKIWDCVDSNNLRWDWNGNSLRSRHNGNIAVDAYGSSNGANVGQWVFHGGANQQWNWVN